MIYENGGVVLLISKDRNIKKFFRNVISKFENTQVVIDSKIENIIQHFSVKVIFIDTASIKSSQISSYLKILQNHYIAVPLFIIIDKEYQEALDYPIESAVNYRTYLVVQKPIQRITIESILFKYIISIRDRNSHFKKCHGLILNEKHQYVIYNECKIFLSQMECFLISLLMENDKCIMTCNEIKTAIQNRTGKNTSNSSVRICIYRIRKKFKEAIGLDIIGNKHGVGYYIAI